MTFTYEQGMSWARIRKHTVRLNWNGMCEALMWWMLGGATASYHTATIARNRSRLVSMNWNTAPPGAFHWWDIDGVPAGHVAVAAGGGMAVMASGVAAAAGEDWGNDVALIGVPAYNAAMGGRAHYRGWSYDHAGAYFSNGVALAVANPTVTVGKDQDMRKISAPSGTIALVGEFSARVYTDTDPGQSFSMGTNAKVYGESAGLTNDEVMTAINEAKGRRAALIAELAEAVGGKAQAPVVDYAKLAEALRAGGLGDDMDTVELGQAVEGAVRRVFADAATQ